MLHQRDDVIQAVFPVVRVNGDIDVAGKIAQRAALVVLSQVDGHGELDGPLRQAFALVLLGDADQGLQNQRRQIGIDRRAAGLGRGSQTAGIHHADRHLQVVPLSGRAAQRISGFLAPRAGGIPGVDGKAVFPLAGFGFVPAVQYIGREGGDTVPMLQPQILRDQGQQEGHRARAVSQHMEDFHRYAAVVNAHAEHKVSVAPGGERQAGVDRVGLNARHAFLLLQIKPKQAAPQTVCKIGQTLDRGLKRLVQERLVHGFIQGDRQAVNRHPAEGSGRRVDLARVIQLQPLRRRVTALDPLAAHGRLPSRRLAISRMASLASGTP